VAELELSEHVEFLKVGEVLPAFSNVVEFVEIKNLPSYSLPVEMRIGVLDGKFFVFNETVSLTKQNILTHAQVSFSMFIVRFLGSMLSSTFAEKFGKVVWYRFISNLNPDSKIRRLSIALRNNRDVKV
jgi:hypothetical protein